jgi:hypothetical protein
MRVLPLPAAVLLFCAACATTTFTSTWQAPDAGPVDYAGKKIAAVFLTSEESTRRVAEDALAREFSAHGSVGVASYTLLSSAELKDEARSRAALLDAGCTASVVMRITGGKGASALPGRSTVHCPPYPTTHWTLESPTSRTPIRPTRRVRGTLMWRPGGGQLLWESGTTFSRRDRQFVVDLATAAAEMRAAGLIR